MLLMFQFIVRLAATYWSVTLPDTISTTFTEADLAVLGIRPNGELVFRFGVTDAECRYASGLMTDLQEGTL